MRPALGFCGFCGRALDADGARVCDCARSRRVALGLLETVRRAARLTHQLPPRPGATTVTHFRRAMRAASNERTAS